MELERYRIEVNGIVQGVGFRPFIYKLAKSLDLKGEVRNTSSGVLIDAEGVPGSVASFVDRLSKEAPALSHIETIKTLRLEPAGYDNFCISESSPDEIPNTLISPDISICADCRRELFDPSDRRFLYPFINCTNCGPRYTIICDIPYDRPNTTMGGFDLCDECNVQYRDPADRRYHAQPVCCEACGPGVLLLDKDGTVIEAYNGERSHSFGIIKKAAELLASGKILAVKSLGGYHLVCDAANESAVVELRGRKHRDEKPFALMARDMKTVRKYCESDEMSEKTLQSPSAPIVLLRRKASVSLPPQLAPGNVELGIMLPYTPVHLLMFFGAEGKPSVCPELLVMTSGNKSDEPICFEDAEALARLRGIADYFLTNDRPIRTRTDDSVVRIFENDIYFIRRSRGYAPSPIITGSADLIHAQTSGITQAQTSGIAREQPSILALGAELKNTFCLTRGSSFFVSQHIGDLENMETLRSFEDGITHYERLFGISPKAVAYDMHPAYLTTAFVNTLSEEMVRVPVQHHQAHIASCMAENGLSGDVIGVSFDGTGYGEDGAVWGGEFFTGSYKGFRRAAHLEYFGLPGGAAAVKEPWRPAAACLHLCGFELRDAKLRDLLTGRIEGYSGEPPRSVAERARDEGFTSMRMELTAQMLEKSFNTPQTSSMGRLFDAVSALTGTNYINRFEGQAAMLLENAAEGYTGKPYGFDLLESEGVRIISIRRLISEIMDNVMSMIPTGIISARFHETAACMVEKACVALRSDTGLDRVVLSGGVFQNMRLLSSCTKKLRDRGFEVFIHRRVPANDGGISLGQAAIAMARLQDIC